MPRGSPSWRVEELGLASQIDYVLTPDRQIPEKHDKSLPLPRSESQVWLAEFSDLYNIKPLPAMESR